MRSYKSSMHITDGNSPELRRDIAGNVYIHYCCPDNLLLSGKDHTYGMRRVYAKWRTNASQSRSSRQCSMVLFEVLLSPLQEVGMYAIDTPGGSTHAIL